MRTAQSHRPTSYLVAVFLLVLSFSMAISTANAQTSQDTITVTFDEAIDLALENNYALKQANNNLAGAEHEVKSAKADFLPSVSASLRGNQSVGRQFNNIQLQYVEETSSSVSGSFGADIQLFQGLEKIKQLRKSEVSQEVEQQSRERTREDVIFNAATRYLQVLVDQELLEIARENLEASQTQLEQVTAQVEVGSRPSVDQYNQESTVANNELTVIQRENQLNYDKIRLVRTLQLDPFKNYKFEAPNILDKTLDVKQYSLNELVQQALTSRSDLMAQRKTIELRKYDVELAQAALYPTVTANVGISSSYRDQYRGLTVGPGGQRMPEVVGFADQFFNQLVTYGMGFNISIPIFSNLNRSTNIDMAKIQAKNAMLELENREYAVQEEIRQAYNDYVSLAKELETTEKALKAARKTYETQRERYAVGSSSLIELRQANADYVQAQADRVQAQYNFVFQEKLLDYYVGKLTEDISL